MMMMRLSLILFVVDNNDDGSKKIYNSKMSLSGNTLSVSGCILIFCKAQNWTKVN